MAAEIEFSTLSDQKLRDISKWLVKKQKGGLARTLTSTRDPLTEEISTVHVVDGERIEFSHKPKSYYHVEGKIAFGEKIAQELEEAGIVSFSEAKVTKS